MKRVIHHKLTLEAEVGVGLQSGAIPSPDIMMRFSNDGGHTWSTEKWKNMGLIGEYFKRVYWHRLGMTTGQPRIYELSGTAPVKTMLLNAYLE